MERKNMTTTSRRDPFLRGPANAIWMENVRQKDGRAGKETEGMTSKEEDPDEPDLDVRTKGVDSHEAPGERVGEREGEGQERQDSVDLKKVVKSPPLVVPVPDCAPPSTNGKRKGWKVRTGRASELCQPHPSLNVEELN